MFVREQAFLWIVYCTCLLWNDVYMSLLDWIPGCVHA